MFGAYTQCPWPQYSDRVGDPSGKSFLFSLTNAAGKAARFSLHNRDEAFGLTADLGIYFGMFRANCILYHQGKAANMAAGNTANSAHKGSAYQPDDGDFTRGLDFFAGSKFFAAADIEVYEL